MFYQGLTFLFTIAIVICCSLYVNLLQERKLWTLCPGGRKNIYQIQNMYAFVSEIPLLGISPTEILTKNRHKYTLDHMRIFTVPLFVINNSIENMINAHQ